jgi:cytochrome P450
MCLQDIEVAGYTVRKGQDVAANVYAMQRHPEIWPQPNAWLPQRWLPEGAAQGLAPKAKNAFLPFSTGARSCIGRSYAMLQMVLSMAVLLGRGIRLGFAEATSGKELVLAKGLSMYAESGVWLVPVVVSK